MPVKYSPGPPPTLCVDSPISPWLGDDPSLLVAVSDPFQPCGPCQCASGSCGSPGGSSAGPAANGGALGGAPLTTRSATA